MGGQFNINSKYLANPASLARAFELGQIGGAEGFEIIGLLEAEITTGYQVPGVLVLLAAYREALAFGGRQNVYPLGEAIARELKDAHGLLEKIRARAGMNQPALFGSSAEISARVTETLRRNREQSFVEIGVGNGNAGGGEARTIGMQAAGGKRHNAGFSAPAIANRDASIKHLDQIFGNDFVTKVGRNYPHWVDIDMRGKLIDYFLQFANLMKTRGNISMSLLPNLANFPDLDRSLDAARVRGLTMRVASVDEERRMESLRHNVELTTNASGKSELIWNLNSLSTVPFCYSYAHEVAHLHFIRVTRARDATHASTLRGLNNLFRMMKPAIYRKWKAKRNKLSDRKPPFSVALAVRGFAQISPRAQFEEDTFKLLDEWYAYKRELSVYGVVVRKRLELRTRTHGELASYSSDQLLKTIAGVYFISDEIVSIFRGTDIVDVVAKLSKGGLF